MGLGRFRLPTEAEWEYACRAGSQNERYGDLEAIAWFKGNSGKTTHPVGLKLPNAWGLYDMNGNVWQWCLDWKGEYPSGPVADPTGSPIPNKGRVNRGGSWNDAAKCVRSGYRIKNDFSDRCYDLSLRLVKVIPDGPWND